MYKVVEVTLKTNEPINVEVPYGAQSLGLVLRNGVPRLLLRVPDVAGVLVQAKILTVPTGESFGEIGEVPKYVGTFNFGQRVPNPVVGGPPVEMSFQFHVFIVFKQGGTDEASGSSGSSLILP